MISLRESPFRAFSARRLIRVLPQGVALVYYISRPWRSGLKFSHTPVSGDPGDATFVQSLVSAVQLNVEPAPDASHKPRELCAHLPESPLTRPTAAPADRRPVPGPAQDGNPPGPCWLPL